MIGRRKTPWTGDTPLTSKQYKHSAYEDEQEHHISIEPCAHGQRTRKDGTDGRAHKRSGAGPYGVGNSGREHSFGPFVAELAVRLSGNVFVTGNSYGGTNTDYDYATVAYSSAGVALWTNRYGGSGNAADFVSAMAVDSSGNVFVTGSSDSDYVTIKYSSSLTPPRLSIVRDGSGGWFIRHTGVPDVKYRLQRAASLSGPWSDVATNTAPASGLIEYQETNPPPSGAFYRAIQP